MGKFPARAKYILDHAKFRTVKSPLSCKVPSMFMLTTQDIIVIHNRVARDARDDGDPIATMVGSGVRSTVKDSSLLESAVARQHSGSGNMLFYPDPISNAATLMYGLAKNHAFHDGNKRTALVSMLNHLDRNRLTLVDMKWKDVEELVLNLVVGELPDQPRLKHAVARCVDKSERDVRALTEWIRLHARSVKRGERIMTYDELDEILKGHGYELGDPYGNSISVYKVTTKEKPGFFGKKKTVSDRQHIGAIAYPGGRREVAVSVIKQVRRVCRLTEEEGVDSSVFYGDEGTRLDTIINKYRKVLRSLADK
jgi:prophage maintenance system killer protein